MDIILHVNRICKRLFFIHNLYYLKVAKKIDYRYNTKDRTLVCKAGKSGVSCQFFVKGVKDNVKTIMETGQYVISGTGSAGKL